MQDLITLVIASHNKGKKSEIIDLLKNFPVLIKNLDDFGSIPPVEEDGHTFTENAYKKASITAKILGLPALADDSGIMVEALGGAPGIHSARYAGKNATDEQRCSKLLKAMQGKKNRRAAFKCAISIAVPSGSALTYLGDCEGLIGEKPVGSNGFGYDPIFYSPLYRKTFAELDIKEKSLISHRGKALKQIRDEFDKILIWIRQNRNAPKK
ncbi:MAG: XTP/dITP diphosphatase [Desulfobacterales bacterium]|nr:XTP/dITP diphosphatase [Desulfobacterales bacterium]